MLNTATHHDGLLAKLVRYSPEGITAYCLELGWLETYNSIFSVVFTDQSGLYALKCNRWDDRGYEVYVEVAKAPGGHNPHIPKVYDFVKLAGQGSLTLLEKLEPLEQRGFLHQHRRSISAGFQVQLDHLTGRKPQFDGSFPAIKSAMGTCTEDLYRLAAMLGACSVVSQKILSSWTLDDVMQRADGTEVLIDPFDRT
jgi:hypothetical protein